MVTASVRRLARVAVQALFWAVLLACIGSFAQQDQSDGNRRVVNRVVPNYPQMARSIHLRGNVRLEALVAPNGTVKAVDIKGGHPILVEAAERAILKWKWETTAHETREPVEFRFDPQ
jgi:TonB family protein